MIAPQLKEDAVKKVREHVRNKIATAAGGTIPTPLSDYPRLYPRLLLLYSYIGLVFTPYGISARPSGYPLAYWYGNVSILGLDFTFEVRDEFMDSLRDIVYIGMEEEGMDFIPVSHNAFDRLHLAIETLRLVDRDGMQCVFSGVQGSSTERQYYISGYDANETPPLYFLARLPHEVQTYKDAIEALKPESVKLAETRGLEVLRQGDMFAIPTKYNTNDLKKMGAEIHESIDSPMTQCNLYGTAHCTEKMARLPDGTQLGCGVMMHRPLGRPADHRDLLLSPAKWYIIVKNTVPVQVNV